MSEEFIKKVYKTKENIVRDLIIDVYKNTHLFSPFSNFLFYLLHPILTIKYTAVGIYMMMIYMVNVDDLKGDDKNE